ncbi:MAG: CE1759 family FMN reductase [Nocardioidaceae bacterium]
MVGLYRWRSSPEKYTSQSQTSLGSQPEALNGTLGFREYVGDYQRQLFLIDHAGLPTKTVLEQLRLLGEESVMGSRRLAVVSSGVRQPSSTRMLADRLAAAAQLALTHEGFDVTTDVIELRDHADDLTNNVLTGFPNEKLRRLTDSVVRADGLIAVTPIFTASYSGLFKMFFDVLDADSLIDKPVLVAATGGSERHSLALDHALRPLFTYLRAVVVPTGVYAATSDWGAAGADGKALGQRIDRAAGELATLVSGGGHAAHQHDGFADLSDCG